MLGVVDVGWGLESEKTVLVEVEAVTIDIQVPVAPGGHEEIVFVRVGLVVKDAVRVVDLAEILVGAVFAGGVDLFEAALEQIAGGLVCFYDALSIGTVGVDVRGVLVDPVGFKMRGLAIGRLGPVVGRRTAPSDAVYDHAASW